jgi:hypothetical protein
MARTSNDPPRHYTSFIACHPLAGSCRRTTAFASYRRKTAIPLPAKLAFALDRFAPIYAVRSNGTAAPKQKSSSEAERARNWAPVT